MRVGCILAILCLGLSSFCPLVRSSTLVNDGVRQEVGITRVGADDIEEGSVAEEEEEEYEDGEDHYDRDSEDEEVGATSAPNTGLDRFPQLHGRQGQNPQPQPSFIPGVNLQDKVVVCADKMLKRLQSLCPWKGTILASLRPSDTRSGRQGGMAATRHQNRRRVRRRSNLPKTFVVGIAGNGIRKRRNAPIGQERNSDPYRNSRANGHGTGVGTAEGRRPESIIEACCRNPCNIAKILEFCPLNAYTPPPPTSMRPANSNSGTLVDRKEPERLTGQGSNTKNSHSAPLTSQPSGNNKKQHVPTPLPFTMPTKSRTSLTTSMPYSNSTKVKTASYYPYLIGLLAWGIPNVTAATRVTAPHTGPQNEDVSNHDWEHHREHTSYHSQQPQMDEPNPDRTELEMNYAQGNENGRTRSRTSKEEQTETRRFGDGRDHSSRAEGGRRYSDELPSSSKGTVSFGVPSYSPQSSSGGKPQVYNDGYEDNVNPNPFPSYRGTNRHNRYNLDHNSSGHEKKRGRRRNRDDNHKRNRPSSRRSYKAGQVENNGDNRYQIPGSHMGTTGSSYGTIDYLRH